MLKPIEVVDAVIFILVFLIVVLIAELPFLSTKQNSSNTCAYCQSTISEHADKVICTDGRMYHAECYMRYIEEKQDGKQR